MGILRSLRGGDTVELAVRTLVGRGPRCQLQLTNRKVSGEHAALAWTGAGWEVRDLGSRNGTYVDGQRLSKGARAAVAIGSMVAFGDPDGIFEWISVAPPPASARDEGGAVRHAEEGVLVLPDDTDPQVTIFCRNGRWVCDDEDGTRPAPATIALGGRIWTLTLPQSLATTVQAAVRLAEVRLDFTVSRDEEHVEIAARFGERPQTLRGRAHHYLLAVLARLRLEGEDGGWVHADALTRMLAMDRRAMNVQIFRARQEFARLGVLDAADLIERRAGGKLRLGVSALTVAALDAPA